MPFPPQGHGSYDFKQAAPWVAAGGTSSADLAVGFGDFNNDGNWDYVTGNISGTTATAPISMFLGNGKGSYIADTSLLPHPVPGTVHARKVVVADFDGDGIADFLIADHGYDAPPYPGATPLLMMNASGKFVRKAIPGVPTGFQHGASAADVKNNGTIDVVVLDQFNGSFYLSNDGHGDFTLTRSTMPDSLEVVGAQYYTCELIDVDGDGSYDLVVGGHEQSGYPTIIFWGDGSGSFSDSRSSMVPGDPDYPVVLDVVAEDIDGSGTKTLILNRTKANPFYEGYYFQVLTQSHRQFVDVSAAKICPNKATWAGSHATWVSWIQLVDTRGSGHRDIRVMDRRRHLVFANDGNGNFSLSP